MRNIVAVRANGSRKIGSGHLRRVSLLAQAFKQKGLSPILLCNAQAKQVFPNLEAFFDVVHVVPTEEHARGVLLQRYGCRLWAVLFDSYDLGAVQHRIYRGAAENLVALDDVVSRTMDVDILFNVNLGVRAEDYVGLLPDHAPVHVGAEYQIIRPDFLQWRGRTLQRREGVSTIDRVFIGIGGTDPFQISLAALRDVVRVAPGVSVDVVVGSASPGLAKLQAFADRHKETVSLHIDATDVAALMSRADLGIGAGGTMTWERNCLGLPTVLLTIADNQLEVSRFMQQAQAAIVFDARRRYPSEHVTDVLEDLFERPAICRELSRKAAKLAGCNGAENVVRTVLSHFGFSNA